LVHSLPPFCNSCKNARPFSVQAAYEKYARPLANKLDGKREFKKNETVEYVDEKGNAHSAVVSTVGDKTVDVVDNATGKVVTHDKQQLQAQIIGDRAVVAGQEYRAGDKLMIPIDGAEHEGIITDIVDGKLSIQIPNAPLMEEGGRNWAWSDYTPEELESLLASHQTESIKTSEKTPENEVSADNETQQNESEQLQKDNLESQDTRTKNQDLEIEDTKKVEFPRDKEGHIDYLQITDDAVYSQALQEEFGDEAHVVADEYLKSAEKALKHAERISDPIKKRREQAKRKAEVERWSNMYEQLRPRPQLQKYEQEPSTYAIGNTRQRESAMGEYLSLRDYLLRGIGSGKFRFLWNSKDGRVGLKDEIFSSKNTQTEMLKRIAFLDNNGYTPESLAHYVWEQRGAEIPETWANDVQDIRDEINDILLSHDTPTSMIDAAEALRSQPETLEEYIEQTVSPEEIAEYEANEASQNEMAKYLPEEKAKEVSEQELDEFYNSSASQIRSDKVASTVDVPKHTFTNFKEAEEWAKNNIVGTYNNEDTGIEVYVSNNSISKFLSGKAIKRSVSKDAHLSALTQIPKLIETSVLRESHPDRDKNPDIKEILRFEGRMNYEGVEYPVKITVKAYQTGANKAYNYEVMQIESPVGNLNLQSETINPSTPDSLKSIREGGQVLITVKTGQPSEISALPDNSIGSKDSEEVSEKQEKTPKFTGDVVSFAKDIVKKSQDERIKTQDGESKEKEVKSKDNSELGVPSSEDQIVSDIKSIDGEIELTKYIKSLNPENITEKIADAIYAQDLRVNSDMGVSSYYKFNPETMKYDEVDGFFVEESDFDNAADLIKWYYFKIEPNKRTKSIIDVAKKAVEEDKAKKQEIETNTENTPLFRILGEKGASRLENAERVMADLRVAREMETDFNERPKRLEKLRKSEPISITGKEITPSDDLKEYKKNASEYAKGLRGSYTNKDTGDVIELTSSRKNGGIREILQHDYKDVEHLQSVAAIPQIIENSIYIGWSPNADNKVDAERFEYYVSGLNIGGSEYTVKSVVVTLADGSKYYDHKLTSIEKGRLIDLINNKSAKPSNPISNELSGEADLLSDVKDKRLLSILQTDEKENAKKIRLATGWERGADGKWRYETPDEKVDARQLYKGVLNTLGKIMPDSELLRTYPELSDVKVLFDKLQVQDARFVTEYNSDTGSTQYSIVLNERFLDDINRVGIKSIEREIEQAQKTLKEGYSDKQKETAQLFGVELQTPEQLQQSIAEKQATLEQAYNDFGDAIHSTLIHEVQHAIQKIEGFAGGGSMQQFITQPKGTKLDRAIYDFHYYVKDLEGDLYENIGRVLFDERFDNFRYVLRAEGEKVWEGINDTVIDALSRSYKNHDKEVFMRNYNYSVDKINTELQRPSPYTQYKNLAGEVEARNVQARMNYTPEQRREMLLQETEDVAREQQIVLREALGEQESKEQGTRSKDEVSLKAIETVFEKAGIPVEYVTDEEAQRKYAEVRARESEAQMRRTTKKASPDTAVGEQGSPLKATVISSDAGTKILQNLDKTIAKYENISGITKAFIVDIRAALNLKDTGKSQYGTFETPKGEVFTLRLSNHNATVSNFDNNNENNGVSIVISRKPNTGIENDGNAHVIEFFYPDKAINKSDSRALAEIAKSVKQLLYSGEYKDTTGLAEVEEVNEAQFRLDRADNPIGDGSWHVEHDIINLDKYPQVDYKVNYSDTTESVYVEYTNKENNKSVTVRFSNHENNAVKFGDQLNGNWVRDDEILYRLGLKNRIFIPETKKDIGAYQVKRAEAKSYEEADKTIQELYDLPVGTDLSAYKGKRVKSNRADKISNWIIGGDVVKESQVYTSNILGQHVPIGKYEYTDIDEGSGRGTESGDVQFHAVWHGSPHMFDRFSTNFIRTGQGVNMYGWGLYFTDLEDIGRSYAKALTLTKSQRKLLNKAITIANRYSKIETIAKKIESELSHTLWNDDYDAGIYVGYNNGDYEIELTDNSNGNVIKRFYVESLIGSEKYDINEKGNLYKVKIHGDKTIDELNFIRWDKELAPEQLKAISKQSQKENVKDFTKSDFPQTGEWLNTFLVGNAKLNPKEASLFLLRAGIDGIQYPTEYTTKGEHENSYNYVVFDENAIDIEEHIQFFTKPPLIPPKGGKSGLVKGATPIVYGWTENGKVYLVKERLNPETPIHEYDHLWNAALRKYNPELWKHGVELLKQTPMWEQIKNDPNYSHLKTDDQIADEVKAHINGKNIADTFAKMQQEAKDTGDITLLARATKLINDIKNWLKDTWYWLMDTMTNWSRADIERVTLDDFLNMTLSDMIKGTPLSPKGEVSSKLDSAPDGAIAASPDSGVDVVSSSEFGVPSDELAAIKERAIADGTFMKAPNSKATNLTEKQWLQVRTKAFKKWFGDWELANKLRMINNIKPIKAKPHNLTKEQLQKKYAEIGTVRNDYSGVDVEFYKSAFNKNYRDGGLFAKAVPYLAKTFENSVLAYQESDTLGGVERKDGSFHKEHRNVRSWDNYVGKIEIDGKDYYVRFTVQAENSNKSGLHSSFITNIELYNKPTVDASIPTSGGARLVYDGIVDTKLQEFFEKAREAEENSSKVVDENGDPLVVYHGTNERFAVFKSTKFSTAGYFAKNRDFAAEFSKVRNTDPSVMDVFLNIPNILDLSKFNGQKEYNSKEIVEILPFLKNTKLPWRVDRIQGWLGVDEVINEAKKVGYNGVAYNEANFDYSIMDEDGNYGKLADVPSFIAFNPTQIKSATDNIGTFDVANDDIRFRVENKKARQRADELMDNADDLRKVIPDYNGFLNKVFQQGFTKEQRKSVAKAKGNWYKAIERELATIEDAEKLEYIAHLLDADLTIGQVKYLFRRNLDPNDGSAKWQAREAIRVEDLKGDVVIVGHKPINDGKLEAYEKIVKSKGFRHVFEHYNSDLPLREFQQLLLGKDYYEVENFRENAYQALKLSKGRGRHAMDMFTQNIYKPLIVHLSKINDKLNEEKLETIKSDLKGNKSHYMRATVYAMAKSGLSRMKIMARRDADAYKKELLNKPEINGLKGDAYNEAVSEIEKAAEKQYKAFLKRDVSGLTALAELVGRKDENFKDVAESIVKEVEGVLGKEEVDKFWDEVFEATQWANERSFESGKMSREEYERRKDRDAYYLPHRGYDITTAADIYDYKDRESGNFDSLFLRAKGRTTLAEDPFAHIASMAASAVLEAERNKAKQALLRLIETHPNDIVSVRDAWVQNVGTKNNPEWVEAYPKLNSKDSPETIKKKVDDFERRMKALSIVGMARRKRNSLNLGEAVSKTSPAISRRLVFSFLIVSKSQFKKAVCSSNRSFLV